MLFNINIKKPLLREFIVQYSRFPLIKKAFRVVIYKDNQVLTIKTNMNDFLDGEILLLIGTFYNQC